MAHTSQSIARALKRLPIDLETLPEIDMNSVLPIGEAALQPQQEGPPLVIRMRSDLRPVAVVNLLTRSASLQKSRQYEEDPTTWMGALL